MGDVGFELPEGLGQYAGWDHVGLFKTPLSQLSQGAPN